MKIIIRKPIESSFFQGLLLIGLCMLIFSCISSDNDTPVDRISGKWRNEITVPPDPVYVNTMTFAKEDGNNVFVDQNNHSGSWEVEGDSITWIYKGVSNLENTFKGKISEDGKSMEGINYGTWNNEAFEGTWKAVKTE